MKLKIVHISDTHCKHEQVKIPKCDVLIHSGDISNSGTQAEIERFFYWFTRQDSTYKILVAGNHDIVFDQGYGEDGEYPDWFNKLLERYLVYDNLQFYLKDSSCEIEGVSFWGSPHTPEIRAGGKYTWAFTEPRRELGKYWMEFPKDLDILITHGPSYGKLDSIEEGENVGCKYLRWHIEEKKPKVHLFGHIHEDYGMSFNENTMFLNSSIVNRKLLIENEPQLFTIDCYTKDVSYVLDNDFSKIIE